MTEAKIVAENDGRITSAKTATTVAGTEFLDDSMSAKDLAYVLEHLDFRSGGICTLRVDRGVAKFLIDAVRARCGPHLTA